MTTRQVLIPSTNVDAVAERLTALDHDLDIVLWSPDGVSRLDGTSVHADELQPEAAWISLELFFAGQFSAYVDTILALDSVRWVQGCLAGVDAPPFVKIQKAGIRLSNSDAPNDSVAEYVMSSMLAVVNGVARRIESHKDQKWQLDNYLAGKPLRLDV